MVNFKKFLTLENCIIFEENSASKQMETHLTHIEDLAIERGKQGFQEFVNTIHLLLLKLKGQESTIDVNAKIDGSPALLFGRDTRDQFKNQFFIALKYAVNPAVGIVKEDAKLLHSEKEINQYYGDRPDFAQKLTNLLKELNRAYDNSGNIYQCDVLYAVPSDKKVERIDGEDFIVFKPNVIAYAIPVDENSDVYTRVNNSDAGIVIHDSFKGIPVGNSMKLQHVNRRVDSMIESGKRAGVFVMGANFSQAKVEVNDKLVSDINGIINQCVVLLPKIQEEFNTQYVNSQVMEYIKIYINKQIDLPNGGIFGKEFTPKDIKKFINGFKQFIENRFKVSIEKLKTEKGRQGQIEKLRSLFSFLELHEESLTSLLQIFSKMIKIKKIAMSLVENLTNALSRTFFLDQNGQFVATKGEGHVIFNGDTHVKIVDRLEFTKVNRSRGGQR
jgi:hypothetical protein